MMGMRLPIGGALVMVALLARGAQAQDDVLRLGDEEGEEPFRKRLRKALNFSDEQTEQLRTVREHLLVELEYIRGSVLDGEMTPEEAREQYGHAMRIHRAGRDTILTVDQKALLQRARHFLQEERLFGPPEEPQLNRPHERLIAALELTEAQVAEWRQLLSRARAERQVMHDEGEVPERDDFLRMRDSFRSAFEDLLTPEQFVRLDEIRDNWKRRREEGRAIEVSDFGLEEEEVGGLFGEEEEDLGMEEEEFSE